MATNTCRWVKDADNYKALNIADIKVGDKLIRVTGGDYRWGVVAPMRETVLNVKKVLKTRLVLETAAGTEYRVIVRYSKSWPYSNGDVTTRVEGQSEYSSDSVRLYTPGDYLLEERRVSNAAAVQARELQANVNDTMRAAKDSLTVESASAAIVALQTWVKENS